MVSPSRTVVVTGAASGIGAATAALVVTPADGVTMVTAMSDLTEDEGQRAHPRPRGGTRERLMVEAARLFSEQGYDRTSLDTIGAAAGIAASSVYRHFDAKQSLFLAVADRSITDSRARRQMGRGGGDLPSQLADLFAEYLADDQVERRRLPIELSRAAVHHPEVARSLAAFNAERRSDLAATIRAGRPELPAEEADLLAHLFIVLLMGAIHIDTLDSAMIGDAGFIDFLRDRFRLILDSDPPPMSMPKLAPIRVPPLEEPEPSDGRRARAMRTRRRIYAAAADLFALQGYDSTSVEDIARAVGITVQGLYLHVDSKEQLMLSVAKRSFDGYRRTLTATIDQTPEGYLPPVLAEALGDFVRAGNRVRRRMAVELHFGAWRTVEFREAFRTFHIETRSGLAEGLRRSNGGADPGDAERAALVTLMLYMGCAHVDTVSASVVDNANWRRHLHRRVPQMLTLDQQNTRRK